MTLLMGNSTPAMHTSVSGSYFELGFWYVCCVEGLGWDNRDDAPDGKYYTCHEHSSLVF